MRRVDAVTFFAPGKPAILFEGHIFWSQLKKQGIDPSLIVKGNEDIYIPNGKKDIIRAA